MFFRIETDGLRIPVAFRGHFSGPGRTACWIIGGGPSLADLDCDAIQESPAAKFSVNLCGTGLIRPNLWTAYDPTCRFHRSTYLDPAVLKLLPARRAMDLVPDSTFKVCECPNLVFFDREPQRGFHDFPPSRDPAGTEAVADWQDSLIQAIELAWWLGFRDLFLVGCELQVRPEPEHLRLAASRGVVELPGEPLKSFIQRCRKTGLTDEELESAAMPRPYHFDETKTLAAVLQTDWHYFRIVQSLRLSRRAMALAGLEILSATPGSRLNAFFPYRPVEELVADLHRRVGNPRAETTRGRYARDRAPGGEVAPMRDFKPHNWPASAKISTPRKTEADSPSRRPTTVAMDDLPEVLVGLEEVG